jgi:UDP-N-acetyl-2-amino-2-deoxyglucuronate dehydrogenase
MLHQRNIIYAGQAALAAKHGVHVITEKPMTTRWADYGRMVKACDEAGIRLFYKYTSGK